MSFCPNPLMFVFAYLLQLLPSKTIFPGSFDKEATLVWQLHVLRQCKNLTHFCVMQRYPIILLIYPIIFLFILPSDNYFVWS
jgi:hypothetical protein